MLLSDTSVKIEFVLELDGTSWLVDKLEGGVLGCTEEFGFAGEQVVMIFADKKTADNVKKKFMIIFSDN